MSYETLVDNTQLPADTLKLLQTASAMVGQRRPSVADLLTTYYSVTLWFWRFLL